MRLPSTPRTEMLRGLRQEVRQHNRAGRVILAVDGPDGSETMPFADAFAEVLAEDGGAVYRASIDGFQRPRAERHARGNDSPDGYYRDWFDYATFRRVLIDPFRTGVGIGFQLTAFDSGRDTPVEAQWTSAPRDAVLVVDGVFLLRPELRGAWNWSVWLEVAPAAADERSAARVGGDPDPAAPSNARTREAQKLYVREANPRTTASAIVENSDPANPVRIFGDFC
jgi:uridine kinase